MAGLPERNQGIDRTSKYTAPEFKPGPFEAVVINNLDPEFMGSITVQLRKVNESQGIAFADGELYTAKYLQAHAAPMQNITHVRGGERGG